MPRPSISRDDALVCRIGSTRPGRAGEAVGLVGYGADGAVRAVESWRLIVANAHLHAVRAQLSLSLYTGVGDKGFSPTTRRAAELATLFDQLERLAGVVATMR